MLFLLIPKLKPPFGTPGLTHRSTSCSGSESEIPPGASGSGDACLRPLLTRAHSEHHPAGCQGPPECLVGFQSSKMLPTEPLTDFRANNWKIPQLRVTLEVIEAGPGSATWHGVPQVSSSLLCQHRLHHHLHVTFLRSYYKFFSLFISFNLCNSPVSR